MSILLAVLAGLAVAAIVAGAVAHARQSRATAALLAQLRAAPDPRDVSDGLPARVRDFALRAGAAPGDLALGVRFTQAAEMQLKPDGPWQAVDAAQTVAIGAPGFLWQAAVPLGPVPRFTVVDAYVAGRGILRAWLFGLIPVAKAEGADVDRGEAMRYLAELPWAPDAILGNPALRWRMDGPDRAEASLDLADGPVTVSFRFDPQGDIAEVFARDRPAIAPDGTTVLRDWLGQFRDYRTVAARRIPTEAEVGYVDPGGFRPYFQCRITGYVAHH